MEVITVNEIPAKTLNCPISELRIGNLEKDMIEVKNDVKGVAEQNIGQNEILSEIRTVVNFIIEDKKEQKELNKKQLDTLEEISKTQVGMQVGLKRLTEDVDDIKVWQKEEQKISTINWQVLIKNNLSKLLSGAIWGSLIAGILYMVSKL
jgi:hypothetical protein